MKRKPVGKGAGVKTGYPAVHDPEFRALVKKLALATAGIGAAGVIGLALPACSSPDKSADAQSDFDLEGIVDASPRDTLRDAVDTSDPDAAFEFLGWVGEDLRDEVPGSVDTVAKDVAGDALDDADGEAWVLGGEALPTDTKPR